MAMIFGEFRKLNVEIKEALLIFGQFKFNTDDPASSRRFIYSAAKILYLEAVNLEPYAHLGTFERSCKELAVEAEMDYFLTPKNSIYARHRTQAFIYAIRSHKFNIKQQLGPKSTDVYISSKSNVDAVEDLTEL